jgi:tetratricopeptide (TPR) repeat protein
MRWLQQAEVVVRAVREPRWFDWDGLIRVYCNLGDSQEALRWSDERAKITPDCPQVYELRGQIYRGLDRLDEALADYDKAVELNPQSAIPRVFRGDFYSQRSEWTKALADYDKALELEPSFASLWLQRGDFYSQRGEWPKAIADYKKAHQLETLRAKDINGMAWLLTNCPDRNVWNPDRAIEYATKAVAMAPNDGAFWNTLGAAQYRAGQCKEAVITLSKSMELRSGGNASDWFFLAIAHWQLGNNEEARQWYDKAVAWTQTNKPDDVELRRFRDEAAALLGVTLPTVEPAPAPAAKEEEAKEPSKSTPAPEAAKEEETSNK